MFTECPECSITFRVTAKVLQQAGGRVRCGGCGNAFSALDHLTEELPPSLIEPAGDDLTSDEKFKETSRQLLKTLNELAGPEEVVIEDTGMEWRVLDDEEEDAAAAAAFTEAAPADDVEEALALEDEAQDRPDDQSYDDNTPLDEDEEFAAQAAPTDDELAAEAEINQLAEEAAADAAQIEVSEDADEKQLDLAGGEEEDWTELLDEEAEDGSVAKDMPLEVEEELAAIHSELSGKDEAAPVDLDSQFEMQAEAMGLDITGSQEIADEETEIADAEDDDPTGSGPLDEDEYQDEQFAAKAVSIESEEEVAAGAAPTEPAAEVGLYKVEEDVAADAASTDEDRESTGEFDAQIEVAAKAFEEGEEIEIAAEAAPTDTDTDTKETVAEATPKEAEEVELAEVIELSILDSDDAAVDEAGHSAAGEVVEVEHTAGDAIPEQSEEEMTINQQIDQELMAAAAQDQDLKATIIGLEDDPVDPFDVNAADVETIIMEGDVVRGAMEREREKERKERALARFDGAGNLIDSYIANRAKRGGRRSTDPVGFGMIAGAAVLVLMLVGQGIHAYREELSTFDLFNQTIGVIYRVFGNPVTPEWDIKGWQFEATNGSVADGEDVLTIFSRIGNRSEQPLPYPLVHVSLTDRWEEIIGSRVLEPNEYLADNLDPSLPVVPGDNFTAVITVDEPSIDATGFKLNVCYRVSPGRVRCATEDFKD
jgi:predicted Zn finger-like uncharacterized protein